MQHRKTLMLVLTALFAALTAVGAFFKIPKTASPLYPADKPFACIRESIDVLP